MIPKAVRNYLRKIGSRGGSVITEKKRAALKLNAQKPRKKILEKSD